LPKKEVIYPEFKIKHPILYYVAKMNNRKSDGYMIYSRLPIQAYDKKQKPIRTPIYSGFGSPEFDLFLLKK